MNFPRILRRDTVKGPNRDPEASYTYVSGKPTIALRPKFFELDSENQKWVLAHELGHFLVDQRSLTKAITGWFEEGISFEGVYGRFSVEEGFCDAFAEYLLDPKDLQNRYPEHYYFIDGLIESRRPWLDWIHKHHNNDLKNNIKYAVKYEKFDEDKIKRLRKDFLTLTRNVDRVQNLKQTLRLKKAIKRWDEKYREYVFDKLIPALKDQGHSRLAEALRTPAWDLHRDLFDFPLLEFRLESPYNESPEQVYNSFDRERDKWFKKVRRHARKTWKRMEDALEALNQADNEIQIPFFESNRIKMEGFTVIMKEPQRQDLLDWQERDRTQRLRKGLSILEQGLKEYKRRASKILPVLLKKKIPIIIEMEAGLGDLARYVHKDKAIHIHIQNLESVPHLVHVLAHEMGHHLWRNYLNDEQTNFWHQAVVGGREKLDLRDVLQKWPEDLNRSKFEDLLKKEDPELYIQLEALSLETGEGLLFRAEFEDYIKNQGPVVTVKTGLPTGYSSTNSEEAFCEVLGRMIAYGPKTIPDKGMHWLKEILPQVKTASMAAKIARQLFLNPH